VILDTPVLLPVNVVPAIPFMVRTLNIAIVSLERLVKKLIAVPFDTLLPQASFTIAVMMDESKSLATMLFGLAVTVILAALPGFITISAKPLMELLDAVILDTPGLLPFNDIVALPLVVLAVGLLSVSLFLRLVEKLIIVPSSTLLPCLSVTVAVIVERSVSLATIVNGLAVTEILSTGPGVIVTLVELSILPPVAVMVDTPVLVPFIVILTSPFVVVVSVALSLSVLERSDPKIIIVPSAILAPFLSFTFAVIVDSWVPLATIVSGRADIIILAGGNGGVMKLCSSLSLKFSLLSELFTT